MFTVIYRLNEVIHSNLFKTKIKLMIYFVKLCRKCITFDHTEIKCFVIVETIHSSVL